MWQSGECNAHVYVGEAFWLNEERRIIYNFNGWEGTNIGISVARNNNNYGSNNNGTSGNGDKLKNLNMKHYKEQMYLFN